MHDNVGVYEFSIFFAVKTLNKYRTSREINEYSMEFLM